MSKNLIQGIKNYLANTHRFFNYGSPNVNVLSNLYNATPVEVMTLQNGNVGIGTNVPMSKLDVRGNIVCSNISVIGDFVTMNTITSNTEQMVIENAGTGPALKVTQTGDNSVAEFYDKESGVALFVGNGGNVGVGISNPQTRLVIGNNNQTILSTNNIPPLHVFGTSNSTARFIAPSTQQGNVSTLQLWSTFQNTADNGSRYTARITSGFNGGAWGKEYLAFGVGNNAIPNDDANDVIERMRTTDLGNVGIGTNFPTGILGIGSEGAAFPIPNGNAPLYACRAWVNFGVSGGVVTTYGSGNISSIVRNNIGDFTINFRIAMPNANFASVAGYQTGNGRWMWLYNGTFNTTSRSGVTTVNNVRYYYQDAGTTPADPATACVIVIC